MNLSEIRKQVPELDGLDDESAIDVIHQTYYSDMDKAEMVKNMGYVPPEKPVEKAGILRTAGDMAIKGAQGVVGLGQSIVGLGSLATGGAVGEGMRNLGYDPKRTNEALGEYLSEDQKTSDAAVQKEDSFLGAIGATLTHPRALAGSIVESLPGMIAGMGAASGAARAIGTKAAAAYGGMGTEAGAAAAKIAIEQSSSKLMAIGAGVEGAQSAGHIADDAQAAGRTYGEYAPAALAAGVGTAAIGYGAGKLMGDTATDIATGVNTLKGSLPAKVGKAFLSEGVLEEAPQSAQEQYFTNMANGEPDRMKGVENAAGMGLVTGGVMGGGMGLLHGLRGQPAPPPLADTGPLSRAANAVTAATAAAKPLSVGYNPDPLISFPDGTVGHQADVDNYVNSLPEEQRIDARAKLMGMGAQQADAVNPSAAAVQSPPVAPVQQQNDVPAAPLITHEQLQDMATRRSMAAPTGIGALTQAEQALEQQRQAEEQARQEQAQRDAAQIAEQTKHVDARVAESDQNRAAMNRADLREQIIQNPAIVNKKEAFAAELRRQGYVDPRLTANDHAYIDDALAPVPSAPNELVDAVPERVESEKEQTKTNTAAVDAAITSGMRLKNPSGSVLHKPGSTKIFKLSDKQKAYYLQAIKKLTTPIQGAQEVPELAPKIDPIAEAAHEAATSPLNYKAEPTEAQKHAGNYRLGHAKIHGLDISIENPVGSIRSGIDKKGVPWETTMNHHYGYIRNTTGMDKSHIDTFIGPDHESDKVFVVDQIDPSTGKPDEHKVMLSFNTKEEAHAAYKSNYAKDWKGDKDVTETTVQGFKVWLKDGNTKKPFTESKQAQFIVAPDGSLDFGEITPDMAKSMRRQSGKIRLESGNAQYGLQHIEARHGAQIRSLGFPSVIDFVSDAVKHIDAIWKPSKTTQLVVIQSVEKGKAVFIELKPAESGDFYTVNTAFPVGDDFAGKKEGWKLLWGGESVPAVASGANPFAVSPPNAGVAVTMTSGQSSTDTIADTAKEVQESPKLTKQDLNKLTVKDMTDANLLQAREVFADSPRAPKIEKEIKLRGLDKEIVPVESKIEPQNDLSKSAWNHLFGELTKLRSEGRATDDDIEKAQSIRQRNSDKEATLKLSVLMDGIFSRENESGKVESVNSPQTESVESAPEPAVDNAPIEAPVKEAAPVQPEQKSEVPAVEKPATQAVEPAPIEEKAEPIDTGDDIPVSFFKKIKVDHEVWIEDENKSETVKISAHKALASVREDLSNYKSLLNCLKG